MAGACFIIGWNLVWTSLIMCFIKYVLRIPLRMSEEELLLGDDAIHGEAAYVFGPCEAHEGYIQGQMMHENTNGDEEMAIGGVDPHHHEKGAEVAAKNGEGSK